MRGIRLIAVACVLVLLTSCPTPFPPSAGGTLTVRLVDAVNARTLVPAISMTVAGYRVSGTGPRGLSFSEQATGGSLTITGLAFGDWEVTAEALNESGATIGAASGSVTVHTGETAVLSLTVVPLPGSGSLELAVSWTPGDVESPSITSSLSAPDGGIIPLGFDISGSQASCTATVSAGYHTLSLQLKDNGIVVAGAVEVVRIVAGHPTSGSYFFENVNKPGGTLIVNITPQMADPIPVSISPVPAQIVAGAAISTTASVQDDTPGALYVWYLNGAGYAMGSGVTFGSGLSAGFYRLDVTAFTPDGTRGGSASTSFHVLAPGHGVIVTVAGNQLHDYGGDGGPATSASLRYPIQLAFDGAAGVLYIADCLNSRIRKVGTDGIISTVAGDGTEGFSGDGGPATLAQLGGNPHGVAVDAEGNLYIGDSNNYRIRKVSSSTGAISTIAGGGTSTADGIPATSAGLGFLYGGIAVDGAGNLYFEDGTRVRKVDAAGIITTLAGTMDTGFGGDGGPATSALLALPYGVAVDAAGNVYIADAMNHRVRKVDPAGIITTFAGTGVAGFSGDGSPAAAAQLSTPSGVLADSEGNLYIADSANCRIRKVSPSGIISTVAGTGEQGFSGDGEPATAAKISSVQGLAIDRAGNLYLADWINDRVRKVLR